jgi:hypothetical protein
MASYYMNEAVFDLPGRRFLDKTVHGLDAKLPGNQTLGVLVHRREVGPTESLRQVVDDNIALNRKRLSFYELIDDRQVSVSGVPGVVVRASWRSEKSHYIQLQAHVVFDGKAMIFAVTAPIHERPVCEETFEVLLGSLTWRTD